MLNLFIPSNSSSTSSSAFNAVTRFPSSVPASGYLQTIARSRTVMFLCLVAIPPLATLLLASAATPGTLSPATPGTLSPATPGTLSVASNTLSQVEDCCSLWQHRRGQCSETQPKCTITSLPEFDRASGNGQVEKEDRTATEVEYWQNINGKSGDDPDMEGREGVPPNSVGSGTR